MSTLTETTFSEVVNFAEDPRLAREVKVFLKKLNGAGGPPLETLTPLQARKALADAQAAVDVDLSDRKSTRLNSSHVKISYAVFCLKKKNIYKLLIDLIFLYLFYVVIIY